MSDLRYGFAPLPVGPYSVPTRITVAAAITGVLLLLVGITGAASGLEWDVAR